MKSIKKLFMLLTLFSLTQINAQDIIARAKELLEANKNQEAINLLLENESISNKPTYNEFLGLGYNRLNNIDKAIYFLNKCTEQDDKNAECFYLLGSTYIDKLNTIENFIKKGSVALDAKNNLLKAVDLKPSHVNARVLLSNYYINSPVIVGGSTRKAKIQANEIIKYDPVTGNNLLASIAQKNEDFEEAEAYYLKVLELERSNERIRYSLSSLYFETENYDKAFSYAQSSINQFPEYLQSYYQYAKIASVSKTNIEIAMQHIRHFIDTSDENSFPKPHWAYYRLGMLEHINGKNEDAKDALKKALKLKPGFSNAEELLKEIN